VQDELQNNKLKLLGKLAASLTHEIRNPLTALKLSLEYLAQQKPTEPDDFAETIDECLEAAERIETLTQSFLDFSRKPQKETDLYSLNDIVEKSVFILSGSARHNKILLETDLQKDIPSIRVNYNKILHILINLITNAIEASKKGSRIVIGTRYINQEQKKNVLLEVADNGRGIPESQKEKIFDDFFTSKKTGTGLGLSVCKMILEDYNAEISFDSTEGKGTVFRVAFALEISGEPYEV
jgi:signal transduction histidine kinase